MLLGVDFGTSSIKLALFDRQGILVASSAGAPDISLPEPGRYEENPEDTWRLFIECLQDISRHGDALSTVEAVGIAGTTQINFWRADNRAVRPAIIYGDERIPSQEKMERILQKVPAAEIGAVFGVERPDRAQLEMILRTLPISKWIWLWEEEPQAWQETKWISTTSHGFLASRLSDTAVGDLHDRELNQQIGQLFGLKIPANRPPNVTGSVVGHITASVSKVTGLPEQTPVVLGGIDSQVSLVGGGITRAGQMLNQSGTTDVIALALESQPKSETGYQFPYFFDDLWILSLAPLRGGVFDWGMNILLAEFDVRDSRRFHSIAAESPPGARGLICLPYFQGEKGTVHDPQARGLFLGLNPQHSRADLARAILEGIAFSLRDVIERFESEGFPVKEIRVAGGGAQHSLFNQIKSDVLQRPIAAMEVGQTGCLGAAAGAAAAIGYYPDLKSAAEAMSRVGEKTFPDANQAELYDELYRSYQMLYQANKQVFSSLAEWRQKYFSSHVDPEPRRESKGGQYRV